MERISFLDEMDPEAVQARLNDETYDAKDQMWILNQASSIALGTLMELAIASKAPETVADAVASIISMMIMAAPPEEREKVQDAIMGNSNS
jgi:hypothetical protein